MGGHAANLGTPDVQSTEMRLRREKKHDLMETADSLVQSHYPRSQPHSERVWAGRAGAR